MQRNSLHHRTRKYFRGAGSSGGGTGNCGLRKPKSASHEVFGTHSDILQGEQPVIVDCRLFDAVQAKLDRQVNSFKVTRQMSGALLAGRLYDNRGNRMSPSHTVKRGIKYRYYLSSALLQGQAKRAGSVPRAPAAEIETVVLKAVREHLKLADRIDDRNLVNTRIVRVIVEPERLVIILAPHQKSGRRQTKSRTSFTFFGTRRRQSVNARYSSQAHLRPSVRAPFGLNSRDLDSIDRPWTPVARRTRDRFKRNVRTHRGPRKVQRPEGQYDHLARLPRALCVPKTLSVDDLGFDRENSLFLARIPCSREIIQSYESAIIMRPKYSHCSAASNSTARREPFVAPIQSVRR